MVSCPAKLTGSVGQIDSKCWNLPHHKYQVFCKEHPNLQITNTMENPTGVFINVCRNKLLSMVVVLILVDGVEMSWFG